MMRSTVSGQSCIIPSSAGIAAPITNPRRTGGSRCGRTRRFWAGARHEGLVGDVRGLDEEIIGLAGEALARPGNVDYRVDDEIGDMDAERPEFARDGFGEDALRRLGRREPGKSRAAAFGRRIEIGRAHV